MTPRSEPTPVADPPAGLSSPAPARRRPLVALVGLGAVALAAWGVYAWRAAGAESTDDAQVEAEVVAIAPRIPGQVARVLVKEDQPVKKGDPLVELDTADLAARVALAEAELDAAAAQAAVVEASARGGLSSARAGVSASSAGLAGAAAQVEAARAAVARAEADARRAEADYGRLEELHRAEAISQERYDAAVAQRSEALAALEAARAQLASAGEARRTAEGRVQEAMGKLEGSTPIDAQIAAARARVKAARAQLDLARNQLGYARVVAPADGVVSRLSVREGGLVAAGQVMAQLVPSEAYVVANFKETQLARMRPGQPVEVDVDAYDGVVLHGTVSSLSGGTGARFSLLPPDNASGNFVKVVERVPVRIALERPPDGIALRAGLSATVRVKVR
jgi:membrane fusion protein (multidrug efflux system)